MIPNKTVISTVFQVGDNFACALSLDLKHGALSAEWFPDLPRGMTDAELSDYRAGRNALMQAAAEVTGKTLAIVEPDGKTVRVGVVRPMECEGVA